MKLVIVESPAKAKKVAGFLGQDWRVEACLGHVRDLPESELGIEVAAGFRPTYQTLPGRVNLIRRMVKAAKEAEAVYIATDPDREGEAIAWHLLALVGLPKATPVYRALFHSITSEAVRAAIAQPRPLDVNLVEAQQARRVVDRLVGYLASPVASKALDGKYSAGRVQSVCLRLVVEREREIARFIPETSWRLTVGLSADGVAFSAALHRVQASDGITQTREPLDRLAAVLKTAQFWVGKTGHVTKSRSPLPPFTTAALQQAASTRLNLSPDRTMALAQILYEQGLITYMRTDGVSVAPEAQAAARDHITRQYGADYCPDSPPTYRAKAPNAQEAHEAIRPTDVGRLPQALDGDGAALYDLIWRRFVASQMSPARYAVTGAVIHAGRSVGQSFPIELRAQGRTLAFDGFLRLYTDDEADDSTPTLPLLVQGQALTLVAPTVEAHETRPPARYTEAALVQALEQHGVGRPSTYANTLKAVKDRGYVSVSDRRLVPTAEGIALCDFLTEHFGGVMDMGYTAQLEESLDRISSGQATRSEVLQAFWDGLQPQLAHATEYALSQVKARRAPKPLTLRPAGG